MTRNNYFEWSERFLESRRSDDTIDVSNIDLSIDPDWTGLHSFSDEIDVSGTLTASGSPAIDAQGDVDVATGSAIRDGSGTSRFEVGAGETRIDAYSTEPIVVQDNEGGFDAVTYSTSASAPGTLSLDNSKLDMSGQYIDGIDYLSSGLGSGLGEVNFSSVNDVIIKTDDGAGSKTNYFAVREGGPVEVQNATFGLPQFTSDPSASAGEMWYRSDLD